MTISILKGANAQVHTVHPGDLDRKPGQAGHASAQNNRSRGGNSSAGGGPEGCGETVVTPLRMDGAIHAIEVRCACGEVTVVELSYDAQRPAGQPNAPRTAPAAASPEQKPAA